MSERSEIMKIANPIYDVVFKYLMDDKKIAKLIISKIIDEEIESIEFQPTEKVTNIKRPTSKEKKEDASFTVYRLDFAAKIKAPDGSLKTVLIEIQKAKFPTDIMRFRKYLGKQYMSEANSEVITLQDGREKTVAFPLIAIYFLGHPIKCTDAPILKSGRRYIDVSTGETIDGKEEFIESLSHDSYVIQIPALKDKRRTELEVLLSIFDQSQKESRHILNVNEEDFPEEFRDIIRKLQQARMDEEVQETMDLEDEILAELAMRERHIDDLVDSLSKKENIIQEKDQELNKKDQALSEKDQQLKEQLKLIEELKKKLGNK